MNVWIWTERHKLATFMIAGYLFLLAGLVPGGIVEIRQIAHFEIILLIVLFYGVPFAATALSWKLWKDLTNTQMTDRHEALCLLATWLLIALLFVDLLFILPFEPHLPAKGSTARLVGPVVGGLVLSPMAPILGAIVGTAVFRYIATRTESLAAQVALTVVLAVLEFAVLNVARVLMGLPGILLVFAAAVVWTGISNRKHDRDENLNHARQ